MSSRLPWRRKRLGGLEDDAEADRVHERHLDQVEHGVDAGLPGELAEAATPSSRDVARSSSPVGATTGTGWRRRPAGIGPVGSPMTGAQTNGRAPIDR